MFMVGLFFQTHSFQSRHAALSSLRSSGRITQRMRFGARLAPLPYFCFRWSQKHRIRWNAQVLRQNSANLSCFLSPLSKVRKSVSEIKLDRAVFSNCDTDKICNISEVAFDLQFLFHDSDQ